MKDLAQREDEKARGSMKIPMVHIPPCIDFNPFMDELEAKYNFQHRDYLRKYPNNPEAEYLDFWHWCLDNCWMDLRRGGVNAMPLDWFLENSATPEWVKTILGYMKVEVQGCPAYDDGFLYFMVDW